MISKQEFIEKLDAILVFYNQQIEMGALLHRFFLSGSSIVTFGDDIVKHYISMLSNISNMDEEIISSFVYEGEGDFYIDDKPFYVNSPEDLYEFNQKLIENK